MAPKPRVLTNPFVVHEGSLEQANLLALTEWEEIDRRVENVIISATMSFRSDTVGRYRDIVNVRQVFSIYKHCDVLTTKAIEEFTGCAKRQAQQYLQVISTCNKLITHTVKFPLSSTSGYIDITRSQMEAGYLL